MLPSLMPSVSLAPGVGLAGAPPAALPRAARTAQQRPASAGRAAVQVPPLALSRALIERPAAIHVGYLAGIGPGSAPAAASDPSWATSPASGTAAPQAALEPPPWPDPLLGQLNQDHVNPGRYSAFLSDGSIDLAHLFGLAVRTIVIDPGHGGRDPGTTGLRGLREKDVTLDIAKRLRARLDRFGAFKTLLTREQDVKISLQQRAAYANEQGADLFLSIHVNYLASGPETVIETYYFGPHSDEHTLRLAEAENEGSEFPISSFSEIIGKLRYRFKHQESRSLATAIQRNLFRNLRRTNRQLQDVGIKTAPFVVLLGVDMPSVLTEVTCLNNEQEEARLATPEYREEIAGYLERGIVEYLLQNQQELNTILGAKAHVNDDQDRS
jgi:N-acetylmuramoyl-L-alanine amidase